MPTLREKLAEAEAKVARLEAANEGLSNALSEKESALDEVAEERNALQIENLRLDAQVEVLLLVASRGLGGQKFRINHVETMNIGQAAEIGNGDGEGMNRSAALFGTPSR